MIEKNYYTDILKKIEIENVDIKKRELKNGKDKVLFLFISQLTDKTMLANDIIKPVNIYISRKNGAICDSQEIYESVINCYDVKMDDREEKIIEYALQGMTVIIFTGEPTYLIVNIKKVAKRVIDNPELTYTIRGPRDCFNENIDDNLSLIRYRIKDPKLKISEYEIGRRTKTKLAVLYIKDIANEGIVNSVIEKVNNIDIDGLVSSGELQNLSGETNFFPRAGVIERSDMAAAALLEGKIIVLVEGSYLAIVVPKLFSEFFASCDDFYDNRFIALLAKFVRMCSVFFAVTISALYVAILSFHIDTLPVDFIEVINTYSQGVPFTVFVGALIVEFVVEMLREALLRVPKQIGSAVAVVGGIVIGQAAIAAKIFNPLLLIVASIAMLSTFTVPDYTITNPLRLIKFFLILASGMFGLIGFTLAISIVLINMVSANTFGVPYLSPFAPFNWQDFKNTFFYGKDISPNRPNFLNTKDKKRSIGHKK